MVGKLRHKLEKEVEARVSNTNQTTSQALNFAWFTFKVMEIQSSMRKISKTITKTERSLIQFECFEFEQPNCGFFNLDSSMVKIVGKEKTNFLNWLLTDSFIERSFQLSARTSSLWFNLAAHES